MKYLFFLTVLAGLAILSCKPQGTATQTTSGKNCAPSGRYFNRTVLDACPQKMPVDIPYYAFELDFTGGDTVMIRNGIEKYGLKFTPTDKACEFRILGATQFGDMYFTIREDSSIALLDSAWTNVAAESIFRHAATSNRNKWDYEKYINECVIAGTYTYEDKPGHQMRAIFLPNGQVEGFRHFLAYSICVAGDCLEETEPYSLTIDFTTNKGGRETYVLKLVDGKNHLQFYSIGAPIPDTKGSRPIGPLVHELKAIPGMEME